MRKSLDVLDIRLNMSLTAKVKVAKFSFLDEKSYNKKVIDFNFGRHKDLSTLKSYIHLALAASVNYHFFGWINPYVYLIEVNNCIMYSKTCVKRPLKNRQNKDLNDKW